MQLPTAFNSTLIDFSPLSQFMSCIETADPPVWVFVPIFKFTIPNLSVVVWTVSSYSRPLPIIENFRQMSVSTSGLSVSSSPGNDCPFGL